MVDLSRFNKVERQVRAVRALLDNNFTAEANEFEKKLFDVLGRTTECVDTMEHMTVRVDTTYLKNVHIIGQLTVDGLIVAKEGVSHRGQF